MRAGLLLGLTLMAACGESAPADPRARLERLAAARGQETAPPPGPAWHFRALGRVIFPAEPAPLRQEAELWIGGPDRIKFVMTAATGGGRNVFLLDGGAGCWLQTDARPWREWSSPELLLESLLRWELLRFPWGWQDEIAAAGDDSSRLARATEAGELVLELNPDGLPRAAACAGVRAEVGDWRTVSPGVRLAPFRWEWTGPSGRRAEEYDELREDLRFFDEAFRPPPAAGAPGTLATSDSVERFGVIHARLWLTGTAGADPAMDAPSWWQHGDQRVAALLQDAELPPPPAASGAAPAEAVGGEWWLRWSFVSRTEDAAAAGAQLLQAAAQAGLQVRGSPWLREALADGRAHGQIAVVEVSPQ